METEKRTLDPDNVALVSVRGRCAPLAAHLSASLIKRRKKERKKGREQGKKGKKESGFIRIVQRGKKLRYGSDRAILLSGDMPSVRTCRNRRMVGDRRLCLFAESKRRTREFPPALPEFQVMVCHSTRRIRGRSPTMQARSMCHHAKAKPSPLLAAASSSTRCADGAKPGPGGGMQPPHAMAGSGAQSRIRIREKCVFDRRGKLTFPVAGTGETAFRPHLK